MPGSISNQSTNETAPYGPPPALYRPVYSPMYSVLGGSEYAMHVLPEVIYTLGLYFFNIFQLNSLYRNQILELVVFILVMG